MEFHICQAQFSSLSLPVKPQSLQLRFFFHKITPSLPVQRWSLLYMPLHSNNFNFITKISDQGNPDYTLSEYHDSSSSMYETVNLQQDWPQILHLCIGMGNLQVGKAIHGFLVKFGSKNEIFEGNNLVNLYAKCGRVDDAHQVFDEMPSRNFITWTSLLNGYSQNSNFESTFHIACQMHKSGEKFSEHTCTVILQACGSAANLVLGKQIHGLILKSGLEMNTFLGTSLVTMYSRTGSADDAEMVFEGLISRDIRCWNSMIAGYAQIGNGEAAIGTFIDLLGSGMELTDYTFTNVISACHGDLAAEEGKQLHALALKSGFVSKISVGNAIITGYVNHGLVEEAEKMFDEMPERNFVSWTAILSGYAQNGRSEKAMAVFLQMQKSGISPDSCCLASVLDACSSCKDSQCGSQIHSLAIKLGYFLDVCLVTALIDLYSKCGNLESAKLVFKNLPIRNTASFNAVLTGYTQKEHELHEQEPHVLFNKLRLTGLEPDSITIACLLSLSANHASIIQGKSLHAYTIKSGFEDYIAVGNSLINMYAKCGSIEDARWKFDKMLDHDPVTWNSMVSGYALHGQGKEGLRLFDKSLKEGFVPDEITLLALLQACSYSGLYKEGLRLFDTLMREFSIKPSIEHHVCMVDLLGRAGYLSEALDFVNGSPFEGSLLLWRALLNACKIHRDDSLGGFVAKRLLDLAASDAASHILVSNVYSGLGLWDESSKVRVKMNDAKMRKEVGYSWIEIGNRVHRFVASGRDHPQSREIYSKLEELNGSMKEKVYVPITDSHVHDT